MPDATTTKIYLKRHPEDHWFDECRIEGKYGPILRMVCVERWKTSGLSGDEWRFGYRWEIRKNGNDGGRSWHPVEGYPAHRPDDAYRRLYPLVSEAAPLFLNYEVSVHFYRKGVLAWNVPEIRPLRDAAGFLPWDEIVAREQHDVIPLEEATKGLCMQPGCRNEPTVRYRIKQEYDRCGNEKESYSANGRHFCDKHRRRGDCALEDADVNYEES